jgi:hypothetical protein
VAGRRIARGSLTDRSASVDEINQGPADVDNCRAFL